MTTHSDEQARLQKIIEGTISKLPVEEQKKIQLLRKKDVISWILGDTTFLDPENPIVSYGKKDIQVDTGEVYKSGKRKGLKKIKKIKVEDKDKPKYKYNTGEFNKKLEENEAEWNMKIMKEIRPDLFDKDSKQKSKFGLFGEILVKEYYILTGEFLTDKPEKKGGHDLDLETFKEMIEVKTGSYFTTGTAGEKVPGVPWKYSEVPDLYEKPLLIILIGGDKKESNLVCKSTLKKEKLKKFWKDELNITYISFTKLLNSL
tara:strand:+ start:160 stop:936 length:777 start_codon:yes stop_codon:yes gene_type:complete